MVNTGFCWSFCRSIALLMWALTLPPMVMAQEEVTPPIPSDLAVEYHQCHEVLWSFPLTTLKDFVPKGYGARLSTGDLEDEVKGLRCSDAQIIEYMEHHGLPFWSKNERDEVHVSGHGPSNRVLHFCLKSRGLLNRLRLGKCAGVASLHLVDDKTSFIISHGFK